MIISYSFLPSPFKATGTHSSKKILIVSSLSSALSKVLHHCNILSKGGISSGFSISHHSPVFPHIFSSYE